MLLTDRNVNMSLLIDEWIFQQLGGSSSFLSISHKTAKKETLCIFRHLRRYFWMHLVEPHFEHSSLWCTWQAFIFLHEQKIHHSVLHPDSLMESQQQTIDIEGKQGSLILCQVQDLCELGSVY